MQVTYIRQYFTTPDQGGGTRLYEMGRRLVKMGHQVRMIATSRESGFAGWKIGNVEGIEVHELGLPYSNHMGNLRRICAFLHFAVMASLQVTRLPTDVVFATITPVSVADFGII